jgi:hypothetical protein
MIARVYTHSVISLNLRSADLLKIYEELQLGRPTYWTLIQPKSSCDTSVGKASVLLARQPRNRS